MMNAAQLLTLAVFGTIGFGVALWVLALVLGMLWTVGTSVRNWLRHG